mgnify:CR=1 FL=1
MIGIDTNVLVRYLTQDDPVQSPRARHIIEQWFTVDRPGFISLVALAETVWVLGRSYAMSPAAIAEIVQNLLRSTTLIVQNEREVFAALFAFESGAASFSDALIGALGVWAGCSTTGCSAS